MKFKKLMYGHVLIEKIEEEELIIIYKQRSIINRNTVFGKIIQTSPGRILKSGKIHKTQVKEGDIVIFEEGAHTMYGDLMIVPESNILTTIVE